MASKRALIFHAPNVHTGGGLALLREVLSAAGKMLAYTQLDARAREALGAELPEACDFVANSLPSRLLAELRLARRSTTDSIILCFHGLPPLLRVRGTVVVFLQNRLLLERVAWSRQSRWVGLRLTLEGLWLTMRAHRVDRFVVQTSSMARALRETVGGASEITVCAFGPGAEKARGNMERKYDFVYVASGDAHKNHANLLAAWSILAAEGCTPSLALTVDKSRYPALAALINAAVQQIAAVRIENVGNLSEMEVALLYACSSALIFPSFSESLGLPLIEASMLQMPILASELDYVRDVVTPAETFDPDSPISIARAVRRFMGRPEQTATLHPVAHFVREVMR